MAFLRILILFFLINLIYSLQSYDKSSCYSKAMVPGSRYTCNSFNSSCHTFIVYRSQPKFQNISAIANLFGADPDQLIQLNNLTASPPQVLETGRDVLVPINCTSKGKFFQSNFSYIVPRTMNYSRIACGTFEGLLKSQELLWANPQITNRVVMAGTRLKVPLKCACPDNYDYSNSGVMYLVTYPFILGDGPIKLGKKFGIPAEEIWAANNFTQRPTVYEKTTFLVPLRSVPTIHFNYSDSQADHQAPVFIPITLINNSTDHPTNVSKKFMGRMYIIVAGVLGVIVSVIAIIFFSLLVKRIDGFKRKKVGAPPAGRSPNLSLSPGLVIGMSTLKYSLYDYKVEELRAATSDFSESSKMGRKLHKGRIGHSDVIIQQIAFEETQRNIDIYSKINHFNIVKLRGVCFGESDIHPSYLVFDFDGNSNLRNCLSDRSNVLKWRERTQLAYDIAIGIHHLHHCSIPSYIHMNINCKSVLVTQDGRGKLANFDAALDVIGSTDHGKEAIDHVSRGYWIAPEYLLEGLISTKVDIFGFGVVLLELLSAKDQVDDGSLFREFVRFLGGNGADHDQGGSFEKLSNFIDPCLKDDYVIGEALCMAVLAKACLEDNPNHRPSMNDILKILARMT